MKTLLAEFDKTNLKNNPFSIISLNLLSIYILFSKIHFLFEIFLYFCEKYIGMKESEKIFIGLKEELKKPTHKGIRPFSSVFDANEIKKTCEKCNIAEGQDEEFDRLYKDFYDVSILLNEIFNDGYSELKKLKTLLCNPVSVIIRDLIAIVNHDVISINYQHKKQIQEKETEEPQQLFATLSSYDIDSIDKRVGKIPAQSVLEGCTDSVGLILNYLRYFSGEKQIKVTVDDEKYISYLQTMYFTGQALQVLKTDYDEVLYDGGFIKVTKTDKGKRRIKFNYIDLQKLKYQKLGQIIMNQHIFGQFMRAKGQNSLFGLSYTDRRIKKVEINNARITLKFGQGKNELLKDIATEFEVATKCYYDFLNNVPMPKMKNITVNDALCIFTVLQYIARYFVEYGNCEFSISKQSDFDKIPVFIGKQHLIDSITQMTKFTKSKVETILHAVEASWEKPNNIWRHPLYPCDQDYALIFYPLAFAVPYVIIDSFLEQGGLNMDERGYQFESYLYKRLLETSQNKEFFIQIIPSRKYERNVGDFEEIDLIVNLKEIVILCEVKCIKYPLEPYDHSNYYSVLQKGCRQIKRKAKYAAENPKVFAKHIGDYSKKEIVPVVITNFPLYTNIQIDDVYITDSHSFLSYFATGLITMRSAGKEGDTIKAAQLIYKNEDEFSSKFTEFIKQNPIVSKLMNTIEISELVHPELADGTKFYIKYARVKSNPKYNIVNNTI